MTLGSGLTNTIWATVLVFILLDSPALAEQCDKHAPLYRQVYRSLEPWQGGITDDHLNAAEDFLLNAIDSEHPADDPQSAAFPRERLQLPFGHPEYPSSTATVVKIILRDGVFYLPGGRIPLREKTGHHAFGNYCYADIFSQLIAVAKRTKLPDMDLYASSSDFPFVHGPSQNGKVLPMFSSSGGLRAYDLVVPDCYTLMERHDGQSNFDDWVTKVAQTTTSVPFESRNGVAFGRYNLMCPRELVYSRKMREMGCPRIKVHELTLSDANAKKLLDAGLYQFADQVEQLAGDQRVNLPKVSHGQQANFRYALNLDGGTVAFRLPYLLAMNQTVLQMAGQTTTGFYTDALIPWEHYVPVARDNYTDILSTVEWLNAHVDVAHKIARNAFEFTSTHLVEEGRVCYTQKLLEEYSRLKRYETRPLSEYTHAITLEEGWLLVLQDAEDWEVYRRQKHTRHSLQ